MCSSDLRLNVLTNIVGKLYSQIFREFDNRADDGEVISGDVKYHLGAEGEYTVNIYNKSRQEKITNEILDLANGQQGM